MPAPFIGSHTAIDFLNTAFAPNDEPVETIGDGRAYLQWLVGAELLSDTDAVQLQRRFGGNALDAAAEEARKVREWARSWLNRWRAAPQDDYAREIASLNKLLARQTHRLELIQGKDGISLVERSHTESADALLALVTVQIAKLVAEEEPSLVKHCAGPACTLWFLDRTKAHRRLFCSATDCGNRAKVAAFRQRQRH
ncbi:MAG TPA: CGNR zinc finger domain-containing protein [Steroidobacteraceae bacterium]|jgi:predicted RNA-binding Zn ribbon-like protein